MTFVQSLAFVLPWEGGYTDDPRDPGGATNKGIIQAEYDATRKKNGLQTQSVRNITTAEASDIYLLEYWNPLNCDKLNPGVANCVFDSGVNSGIEKGALWLQQAINSLSGAIVIPEDGHLGPDTVAASFKHSAGDIIDKLLTIRLAFLKRARNPATGALLWTTFGGGWSDRIAGVRAQSHQLAGLPEPKPEAPFTIDINFGQPLEKLTMGSIIWGILGNAQVQSLLRSALKLGGTALFVKAGLDPSTLDGFIGLLFTGVGLVQSAALHATPVVPPASVAPASPSVAQPVS